MLPSKSEAVALNDPLVLPFIVSGPEMAVQKGTVFGGVISGVPGDSDGHE